MSRRRDRERPQPAAGPAAAAPGAKQPWLLVAGVLAAAAIAWIAADALVRRVQAARLPEPPAAGAVAPSVAAQIADADARRQAQPRIGRCHRRPGDRVPRKRQAEPADRVYAIAESLSSDWRWTYLSRPSARRAWTSAGGARRLHAGHGRRSGARAGVVPRRARLHSSRAGSTPPNRPTRAHRMLRP